MNARLGLLLLALLGLGLSGAMLSRWARRVGVSELHEVGPGSLGDSGALLVVYDDPIARKSRETHNDIREKTRRDFCIHFPTVPATVGRQESKYYSLLHHHPIPTLFKPTKDLWPLERIAFEAECIRKLGLNHHCDTARVNHGLARKSRAIRRRGGGHQARVKVGLIRRRDVLGVKPAG